LKPLWTWASLQSLTQENALILDNFTRDKPKEDIRHYPELSTKSGNSDNHIVPSLVNSLSARIHPRLNDLQPYIDRIKLSLHIHIEDPKMKAEVHESFSRTGWGKLDIKKLSGSCIAILKSGFWFSKMGNFQKKPTLTNEDLTFLRCHTGQNKKLIEKWCKKFRKDCPNGEISPRMFENMCEMFFPYLNSKAFCTYIFTTFDTDSKGYIPLKELMIAIGNIEVSSQKMADSTSDEKLKWAIIVHDMWIVMERLDRMCKLK